MRYRAHVILNYDPRLNRKIGSYFGFEAFDDSDAKNRAKNYIKEMDERGKKEKDIIDRYSVQLLKLTRVNALDEEFET